MNIDLIPDTTVHVRRTSTIIEPDLTRVLLRPFTPGDSRRVARIIERILLVPEEQVGHLLAEVTADFSVIPLFGKPCHGICG